MAQHGFNQFAGSGRDGTGIDPNDLAMNNGYSQSFQSHNFSGSNQNNQSHGFSSGGAVFDDDELLDGLGSPSEGPQGMAGGQDYNSMNMAFSHGTHGGSFRGNPSLNIDANQVMNGYSNTPDGDPLQSPFVQNFNGAGFGRVHQNQSMGTSLQSPMSYSGSPHNQDGSEGYLGPKGAMGQVMQRKSSHGRSPISKSMHGLPMEAHGSPGFGPQPIQTNFNSKSPNAQWLQTPAGSIAASYGSGLSSPHQPNQMLHMNEVMLKGGTSMPAKLGNNPVSTQEMKRKRRRESHNLVERRRRDNINERIQDLSRLVPTHRLEDEKIRKMITSGTPLSPTLQGMPRSGQATSGLAAPGARRAAGAGNITTGLPIEDKDKGPNKGDILNGAVSWTRDLMWIAHTKLQQIEELINLVTELGGTVPFELSDDERRMQTELLEAIRKNEAEYFRYTRTNGSGLRVPSHTDYKGDPVGEGGSGGLSAISPDGRGTSGLTGDLNDPDQYWNDLDDDGSGNVSINNLKEEDEYDLEMTQ